MFLTLTAAVHGGISTGANFLYSFPEKILTEKMILMGGKILTGKMPIELRLGYRFFAKGVDGLFVDPVLTYYTIYGVFGQRGRGWMVPFKVGTIPGIQLRIGKAWKDKRISVFGVLDVASLSYVVEEKGSGVIGGISLGAGFEWGFTPYTSFVGHVKLGGGGEIVESAAAPATVAAVIAGTAGQIPVMGIMNGIGATVMVGLEFHSSKYYG